MVAKVRIKTILVCLDDFQYVVGPTQIDLNQTIRTYYRDLTFLYAATLGQFVWCSYLPEKVTLEPTFAVLKTKADELHKDYDFVAFIGTAPIMPPWLNPEMQADWCDPDHFCYVKFQKDTWESVILFGEIMGGQVDVVRQAFVAGNIRNLSHEQLHEIDKLYTGVMHSHPNYLLAENFKQYDDHFNIVTEGFLEAEEMPPPWITWGHEVV